MTIFNGSTIITAPTQGYSDLQIFANDAVSVSRSPWTQQTYVYPWQTQWWTATITFPQMCRESAQPWMSFLMQLQGQSNVFLLGNMVEANPLGNIQYLPLVSLTVNGTNSGNTVAISGFPQSVNALLLPGDNIQIGYRLYKVTAQVNSDSSGNATVNIFPYLRDNPASGTPVTYYNCQGLFRLTSNKRGWSNSPQQGYGIDPIEAVEAL